MPKEFKIAAIQASPIYFDREASTQKACQLIEEAGARGIELAAFGESWIPGYPFHSAAQQNSLLWFEAASEYLEQAVLIPSETTDQLCESARKAEIDVVIGVSELDPNTEGTVYCTLLFICKEGKIIGKHRKLQPTLAERIVWGKGDGSNLQSYRRDYGRISGLSCWEHQMLLPGYTLMMQGTQIHVAAWPGIELEQAPPAPYAMWPRQMLLSRAFASQGACYVIASAGLMYERDIPEKYRPLLSQEFTGGSAIIDPRGEIIVGPVNGSETFIEATVSLDLVRAAKSVNDVTGHYGRPDVFQLLVNGKPITNSE